MKEHDLDYHLLNNYISGFSHLPDLKKKFFGPSVFLTYRIVGVPHNGELPYVIGFPFYQESRELKIDAQIWDLIRWDEEDQIWTLYMMEMWTNFAKFGYVH